MTAGYDAAVEVFLDRSTPDPAADALPRPSVVNTLSPGELESPEERKARAKTRNEQRRALTLWWIERMAVADIPFREKMAFFWHGHFATSIDKSGWRASGGTARTERANSSINKGEVFMAYPSRRPSRPKGRHGFWRPT